MSTSVDYDLLFVSAISVWNRALDACRGRYPYDQILTACAGLLNGRFVRVELYEESPVEPVACFTLRFQKGFIEPVAVEAPGADVSWRVSRRYIEDVVNNQEEFIRDPEKLEWGWLKREAGISC